MASNDDVQAIMSTDPAARLDAIVRRHGGKPKRTEHADGTPRFPPLGKRKVPQETLFEDES